MTSLYNMMHKDISYKLINYNIFKENTNLLYDVLFIYTILKMTHYFTLSTKFQVDNFFCRLARVNGVFIRGHP